jgi:acetyl-CoA C-acetyltransferase
MHRNVAVIGTGETVFRSHHPDKTYVDLAQEAVVAALRDANMEPEEIDAVVYSMAPTEFMGVNDADKWAVDYTWASRSCVFTPAERPAARPFTADG